MKNQQNTKLGENKGSHRAHYITRHGNILWHLKNRDFQDELHQNKQINITTIAQKLTPHMTSACNSMYLFNCVNSRPSLYLF